MSKEYICDNSDILGHLDLSIFFTCIDNNIGMILEEAPSHLNYHPTSFLERCRANPGWEEEQSFSTSL